MLSVSAYSWRDLLVACVGGGLRDHLRERPLPVAALMANAVPPREGEPYGRLPVFRDQTGEVLLVRWRDDTFCAPHDHGDATGFVGLLAGGLVERAWRWQAGELVAGAERAHAAPAIIPVAPRAIHDMKAPGAADQAPFRGPAIAVHFYFPAIQGMTVFDRVRRESLVVSEDCGAWVPRDRALVVKRLPWGAPRAA